MTGLVPIFRPRRFGLAVRPPRPVLGLEEPPLAPAAPVDDDAARREDARSLAPEQRAPESRVPEAPKSWAPAEDELVRSGAAAETASRGADLAARSASAGKRAAAWRACPSPRCRRARRCRADARDCPVPENPEALSAMLTAITRAARGLPPLEQPAAALEPSAPAAPPPRGRARRSQARRRARMKKPARSGLRAG